MRHTRVCVLISCLLINIVLAKRFETRCKLVRELTKVRLPNAIFLGQWMCLIEKVSNRDTAAYVTSPSGKKYYGLYQIPSRWCKERRRGGDCNIACESLLDDDIRDDTLCATKILKLKGFQYWPKWTARCKKDNFITNEIYKCPELSRISPERSSSSNSYYRHKRSTRTLLYSEQEDD